MQGDPQSDLRKHADPFPQIRPDQAPRLVGADVFGEHEEEAVTAILEMAHVRWNARVRQRVMEAGVQLRPKPHTLGV